MKTVLLLLVSTFAFAQDPYEKFSIAFAENFNSQNFAAIYDLCDDNFKTKVTKEVVVQVLGGAYANGGKIAEIKFSEEIPNGKIFHMVCERATFALTVSLDAAGKAAGLLLRPVQTTYGKDVATIISEWHANYPNGGLVVGRLRDGKPEVQYVGVANKSAAPVDAASIFELGSISKPLTGLILHTLIAEGKISLDDPANKFLPKNAQLPKVKGSDILIRHLVTHTSCLPRMPANFNPPATEATNPYNYYSEKELIQYIPQITTGECELGKANEYSNFASGLLGYILTKVSGKTYAELFNARIAKPLKTKSFGVMGPSDKWVQGYTPNGAPQEQWTFTDVLVGAGGVDASGDDMVKLLSFLTKPDQSALGKAVVASTAVLHSTAQGEWCTFWIKGGTPKVIWHNGMTGGFNAFIGWYEGTQIGAFVLVNNHSEKDIATGIGMAVLEELKPK